MDYCRYSAMPVGRFVLDVHGESRDTWPANDALCAALQVINHLQDCAKDYRELNRVYIPAGRAGRGRPDRRRRWPSRKAGPALRRVIAGLARAQCRAAGAIRAPSPARSAMAGLRLEVELIQTLAEDLNAMLISRDPLVRKACIIPRWMSRRCS